MLNTLQEATVRHLRSVRAAVRRSSSPRGKLPGVNVAEESDAFRYFSASRLHFKTFALFLLNWLLSGPARSNKVKSHVEQNVFFSPQWGKNLA